MGRGGEEGNGQDRVGERGGDKVGLGMETGGQNRRGQRFGVCGVTGLGKVGLGLETGGRNRRG